MDRERIELERERIRLERERIKLERERRRGRRQRESIVGLAVDMEVAARAEVFIGNGVAFSLFFILVSCVIGLLLPFVFHYLFILIITLRPYLVVIVHLRREPLSDGAWCPMCVDPVPVNTPS